MIRRTGRILHAFAVWACLASFGILIGVLALLRNFERTGAGGRWRRSDARAEDIDALLDRREGSATGTRAIAEGTEAGG